MSIKDYEGFVPLAQTFLWVILVGGILFRYSAAIDRLIRLLTERIEGGSSFKAGPVEIGQALIPQDAESQRSEALEEVAEAIAIDASAGGSAETFPKLEVDEYYAAEDLGLRAIQIEYGQPIQRQIRFVSGFLADGVFTVNGKIHVVEVKIGTPTSTEAVVRKALMKMQSSLSTSNIFSARIVLVVVYITGRPSVLDEKIIPAEARQAYGDVDVKLYALADLRKKFGTER